jgi:hypothetical protein
MSPVPYLERCAFHNSVLLSKQRMYSKREEACVHIREAVQVPHLEMVAGFPNCGIE